MRDVLLDDRAEVVPTEVGAKTRSPRGISDSQREGNSPTSKGRFPLLRAIAAAVWRRCAMVS